MVKYLQFETNIETFLILNQPLCSIFVQSVFECMNALLVVILKNPLLAKQNL